jgi:hypothetical protein
VKGIKVCSIKGPGPLQRGDNKKCKNGVGSFKNFFSRTTELEELIFTRKLSDIM